MYAEVAHIAIHKGDRALAEAAGTKQERLHPRPNARSKRKLERAAAYEETSNLLEHRGYLGSVHYSKEDDVLHGRLEFIRDLVTYEAQDVLGLKLAFQESVDDYLHFCRNQGRSPDVPLKGSFNVRPGRDLHKRAALYAKRNGVSLNAVVVNALRQALEADRQSIGR